MNNAADALLEWLKNEQEQSARTAQFHAAKYTEGNAPDDRNQYMQAKARAAMLATVLAKAGHAITVLENKIKLLEAEVAKK